MDRLERFYVIDSLLQEHTVVPRDTILERLEISLATFKRDLEYLRDRFNAPIVWDRDAGGYRYEQVRRAGRRFELPGLWFSEREAFALATMRHLLASLDPDGLIGPQLAPLQARLDAILGAGEASAAEIRRRIRVIPMASRRLELEHFSTVGAALLKRQRLRITYRARSTDETTEREVSPQRLVHYRDNWYLDAWCHLRDGMRSFAVDSIAAATIVDKVAREVAERTLDAWVDAGYGIFSGDQVAWARLRFSPERARWVATEAWHPRQRSSVDGEGRYVLEVPYADDRELVLDILRHGAEVEVLAPAELREKIRREHQRAARRNG
jgi:predicted DNA-binding transcriptional regulator YafY